MVTTIRNQTVLPARTVMVDAYGPESGLRTPLLIAIPTGGTVPMTIADALAGPASALSAVAVLVRVPAAATAL